jgi:menaquinone-dependent protoporphyrinogen oxidase
MKPILVLYATREGQTQHIAEHIDGAIRDRGLSTNLRNVRDIREPVDLKSYDGAILAASVHRGNHEPEMVEFVKRHRDELEGLRAAFVSVSMCEASAEDPRRTEDDRAKAAAEVQQVIDKFLGETGWRPERFQGVAGALRYSKYNFLIRFVMKRIAKKASMPTDTSRDYELTDWKALDRFVDGVLDEGIKKEPAEHAPTPA